MNIDFLTGLIMGGAIGTMVSFTICAIIAAACERGESKPKKGKHER